jgi:ATP synthase F0 subunit c
LLLSTRYFPESVNNTLFLEEINIMDAAAAAELAPALAVGLKALGAGLAMLGAIGAGIGIGMLVNGAMQGIARNPDASGTIQTNMILGIAFTEAIAIYTLVVALSILFVI